MPAASSKAIPPPGTPGWTFSSIISPVNLSSSHLPVPNRSFPPLACPPTPESVCGHTMNRTEELLRVTINPEKIAFEPRSLSWLGSLCSCINAYANTAQERAGTDNVVTVLCCQKGTYELHPPSRLS